jgi:hypothetical protein
MNAAAPEARPPAPITSAAEGEKLVNHMLDVMDALVATVEEETRLVREGNLSEAVKLETVKAELSTLYLSDTTRIRANQATIARSTPQLIKELRDRHQQFRALLQINLTVLATAHAVSEGIMRGVSTELARKATPQAYGASGRATTPAPSGMQPLTVSRVL